MTLLLLRQIGNNDDDGDENNDDIDDDDALRVRTCDMPIWRGTQNLDFAHPCLLLAGNSGPGFGAMKTSSSVNLKKPHCSQYCCSLFNLKVCLPQHLPGSSWKQEWLRPNLPSPTTAIRGCSLSVAGV